VAEREHRWVVATDERRCKGRDHLAAFAVVVCFDCYRCPHCGDDACPARRRPGFPPYPNEAA
jgi:hypothetical protein